MLAALVLAGIIYHFSSQTEAQYGKVNVGGRVWADGERYRLELDHRPGQPHQYDVAISNDGDRTVTWINREKNTYETRAKSAKSRSSLLFHLAGVRDNTAGKPRIERSIVGRDNVAGRSAIQHKVTIDYDLRGKIDDSTVKGHVWAEVLLWKDDALPRLPFERPVQTGFPQIDAKIVKVYAELPGMTLRSEMTVTRVIQGGPPVTEKTATVVDEVSVADVDPKLFELPATAP